MLRLPPSVSRWPALLDAIPDVVDRVGVTLREGQPGATELHAAGFVPQRTEQVWRVPLDDLSRAVVRAPAHRLTSVAECELTRVAALDSAVRRQIPGTDGWSTSADELAQSLQDEEFDPATYLVAEHLGTGDYDGLVRVWRSPARARVGCLGVRPGWRRTRLGPALLTEVARRLVAAGVHEVETETDVANRDSHTMVVRHGGVPLWRSVEWSRQPGLG